MALLGQRAKVCPKGHARTPDNLRPNGRYLVCRICREEWLRNKSSETRRGEMGDQEFRRRINQALDRLGRYPQTRCECCGVWLLDIPREVERHAATTCEARRVA